MGSQAIDLDRYELAADLLLKVQAEDAPQEAFVEMLAWCDADPANKVAMEKVEEAWAVGADLTPAPLVSPRTSAFDRIAAWKQERFGRHGAWLLAGSCAALVLAVGIAVLDNGMLFEREPVTDRIATSRAAHERAKLPDGSTVDLGGKSSLSVVYSAQSRVVIAEEGETYFQVNKDPTRPFVVRAGPVTVTTVGTAFVVRRVGEFVSVAVTEGIVDVRVDRGDQDAPVAMRAEAGHRVRFDRGTLSQTLEAVDPDVALAWREGRLQFVDEPLRLVIASVNRYYDRELISDPAVEELRFTGTVFEKGIDTWLQGVATVFPVRIIEIDKRRVMIAPASPSKG